MKEHIQTLLKKKQEVGYLETGKAIIRKGSFILRELYLDLINLLITPLKEDYHKDPLHQIFQDFLQRVNQLEDHTILELGSRNIVGGSKREAFSGYRDYVGFDIHQDENVDVVGDIHQLSSYFPAESFDAVLSVVVFEHLAMPWKAILEINKVLKKDGLLFIYTHPTCPPHELPWDFWRYSKEAFKALLNPYTGFTILSSLEGNPCRIFPLDSSDGTRGMHRHPAFLGVAVLAMKTGPSDPSLSWDLSCEQILQTMYPQDSQG